MSGSASAARAASGDRSVTGTTGALHLVALTAFAIAQPIFDVLGRTPEFLLVRRLDRLDVLLLVGVVSLGPPILLVLVEMIAGLLGRTARSVLHVVLVGVLGALVVLPLLGRDVGLGALPSLGLSAAVGLVLAVAYVRSSGLRAFLTWLAAAAVVFPAAFMLRPPTSTMLVPPSIQLLTSDAESDVPIVMIVFDEFPAFTLVGEDGEIDAALFPNFARLAREGTWFRNATTIATVTPTAVAAILTGNLPGQNPLASPATRSRNLFTLLGSTHEMNVTEAYVPFCPLAVCVGQERGSRGTRVRSLLYDTGLVLLHVLVPPAWANDLPDLAYGSLLLRQDADAGGDDMEATFDQMRPANRRHWKTTPYDRSATFERFIASIRATDHATLNYFHVLLPHAPYMYEPSGKICRGWQRLPPPFWWYIRGDPRALQQRLILQVGWVDTMVGRLLAHLERAGLYDRALLVLVADHGMSFRAGLRRVLLEENACDILSVPLFVKAPHQRVGGPSDRNVELIDVLPTIADVVDVPIPWPTDGDSVFGPEPERPQKTIVGPSWPFEGALPWKDHRLRFDPDFGTRCLRTDRPHPEVAWGTGPARVFRRGPQGHLVGHRVRPEEVLEDPGVRVALSTGADLSQPVEPGASEAPCLVEGTLTIGGESAAGVPLAVAINGTIEAVGETWGKSGRRVGAAFSIPVPARAFRDEPNVVEVFVPRIDDAMLRLVRAVEGPDADAGASSLVQGRKRKRDPRE